MQRLAACFCLLAGLLVIEPVCADWRWQAGGQVRGGGQLQQYHKADVRSDAGRTALEENLALRLNLEGRGPLVTLALHYELLAEFGEGVEKQGMLTQQGSRLFEPDRLIPDDDRRLLRLQHKLSEGSNHRAVQRLDRASVGINTLRFSGTLGRQERSWGNGRVFQVHDLLSTGSPMALDRHYKSGEDMLFAEYLPGYGGEWQLAAVGRREPETRSSSHDTATYGTMKQWMGSGMEFSLLVAQHFGDAVVGAGMAGDWLGAVWRMDASAAQDEEGEAVYSGLVNVDRFWRCWDRTCHGFVEYYRNGFGVADGDYHNLDQEIAIRLARGDLYTLGRDYGAVGFAMEWTPHVKVQVESLWNLNDGSGFNRLGLAYQPQDNVVINAGAVFSAGGKNDEFSGVPLDGEEAAQGYTEAVFIRLAGFF